MRTNALLLSITMILAVSLPAHTQTAPKLDELKREAIAEVDGLCVLTQQMVDQIFSFSELGFQEYETSKYITGILEKNGFKVDRGVVGMPTAWVATYGSGKPVIAFDKNSRGAQAYSALAQEILERVAQ